MANFLADPFLQPLRVYTAFASGFFLKAVGINASVRGSYIVSPVFSVHIINECTSLFAGGLFFCFVLSYPAGFHQKTIGLLSGLPMIDFVNTFRIAINFMVGCFYPSLFTYTHVYMGQILMAIATIGCVLIWIFYVQSDHALKHPLLFIVRVVAISSMLFYPWIWIQRLYVMFMDVILFHLFGIFGNTLTFPHQHTLYVQTFDLVTLSSLVLATRQVGLKRKMIWLTSGFGMLFLMHFLFRLGNVFLTAYQFEPAFKITTIIHLAGQFLLPVMIWYGMVHSGKPSAFHPSR